MQEGEIGYLEDIMPTLYDIVGQVKKIVNDNLKKIDKVYITGNSTRALNITKRVAGGAATGLLLSAISMLLGADPTSAIIAGTSIGAGAGAISAISTRGEEINLIEGSQLEIMLVEPLTVQIYRQ